MKRSSFPLGVAGAVLAAAPLLGQTNHQVRVINNAFVPRNLTIQVGDSVTWRNEGISHNVRADNGSFRCANGCDGAGGNGNPASNAWTVTRTFNNPGTIPYFCEVHGTTGGLGMAGTITVQGGPPPAQAGTLQFSTGSVNVDEGAGSRTVTVTRTGGDDGTVTVSYQTENNSAVAGQDYQQTQGTLTWPDNDDEPRNISIPILDDDSDESNENFRVRLSNPTGGATLGSINPITVVINDNDGGAPPPPPPPGSAGQLRLALDTFEVNEDGTGTVVVERVNGTSGAVAVTLDVQGGGTATENVDFSVGPITVDFANGQTSRSVSVPVVNDAEDEGVETAALALSGPTGGASLGDRTAAQLAIFDNDGPAGCIPGGEALCLSTGNRFKVQLSWRDQAGATGRGQVHEIGLTDSGLFTFFDQNNVEILVKVLNTCVFSNRIWVFFSGTTNQGFTLTVTDTLRGAVRFYDNRVLEIAPTVLDTNAFATCP